MGKRATMFRCNEESCRNEWWEWFEWLTRDQLISFAEDMACPECGSHNWEMTDSSEFAGGRISGEAAYPNFLKGVDTMFELKELLGLRDIEARVTDLEETDE